MVDYSLEIKHLRGQIGMNRREFCEYFGIPYRTVSDWEAGKRHMPEYVFRLIKYKAEMEKLHKEGSRQKFLDELREARDDAATGRYKDATLVIAEARGKYGLSGNHIKNKESED